jgi:tyrosine-protein kinase Etk/Wzc
MNQVAQQSIVENDDDEINFGVLLDTVFLDRKWVVAVAVVIALLGIAYAIVAKPVYESDFTIQIEDSPSSAKSVLGDVSSMFDTKTAATAEIEIIRSRMVVSKAVDNLGLNLVVTPKYFPLVGGWLARRSQDLSDPVLGGYVFGNEHIKLATFKVPDALQGHEFLLIADGKGGFELNNAEHNIHLKGKVGVPADFETPAGIIELALTQLEGKAGAKFSLRSNSRLKTIENLQGKLVIAEKGKSSGIISVKLEGFDPYLTSKILNEISREYIRQNVERKSEEAEKSIDFLSRQLPDLKRSLENSETKYNSLRDSRGTIDIGEEGKGLLQQAIATEVKLLELKQRKEELLSRFTAQHPTVLNMDSQFKILENQKSAIQAQIKKLPSLEQDVLRLTRDVKVNTELYTSLLNTSQQLNLLKASKTGNARLIDAAIVPEAPIKPNRQLIGGLAVLLGLLAGIATAFIRKAMRGGIDNPKMIENATGIPVYATIMDSARQAELSKRIAAREQGQFVLADTDPDDVSIESLRSFRVALQFAMLDAPNNRVLITGPTPGIGKTFVTTNLAAVLAQAGKRVLLIDMDLHKGHLNHYFGLEKENGLSEYLVGEKQLADIVHKEVLANLDFISVGTRVSNPSGLLLNPRLAQLLEEASERYDIVLVDSPPVLLVADVTVIGAHTGTTFMVLRDSISTIADTTMALKRLNHARIKVIGMLFNGQLRRLSSYYGYGYGYGYGYNYKSGQTEVVKDPKN